VRGFGKTKDNSRPCLKRLMWCRITVFEAACGGFWMKALVTGAAGFIGSHLTGELLKKDIDVRGLVLPGENLERLEAQGSRCAPRCSIDRAAGACWCK